jgi:3'(2'), 5'-bisphosphate nucleotidase
VDDHELAAELAQRAGELLLDLRANGGEPDLLRKAGDRRSHEFLVAELNQRRPGDHVLSEEAADNPARLSADRVWIIDPLDGTNEFGDVPRTDWAVHVALWERDRGLTAGAVALPAQGKVLSTQTSTRPGPRDAASPVRVVVSRSRAPKFVNQLPVEISPLGSAGAKAAAVLLGQADAYIHAGGFYEWDSAAPVAVAHAYGYHASRLNGSQLSYNQADLLVPDILVCHPALAEDLLQEIREVTNAS